MNSIFNKEGLALLRPPRNHPWTLLFYNLQYQRLFVDINIPYPDIFIVKCISYQGEATRNCRKGSQPRLGDNENFLSGGKLTEIVGGVANHYLPTTKTSLAFYRCRLARLISCKSAGKLTVGGG